MAALLTENRESFPPTAAETQLAQESSRRLRRFLGTSRRRKPLHVRIEQEGRPEESFAIPVSAFRLLNGILTEMAKGNAVTLMPVHAELTTRQAADILKVSRPFLIEQLEKGLIPFRKVGTHRRVLIKDLLVYKQRMNQNRIKALEELSSVDQELGLGY